MNYLYSWNLKFKKKDKKNKTNRNKMREIIAIFFTLVRLKSYTFRLNLYLFESVIHIGFPLRIKDGGRCKVKTSTHKTIVYLKSESINEFLLVK